MESQEGNGITVFLPTKAMLSKRVRAYLLGGSYAILIPKMWLNIFQCEDSEGNYWVERDIVGNTITIRPSSEK